MANLSEVYGADFVVNYGADNIDYSMGEDSDSDTPPQPQQSKTDVNPPSVDNIKPEISEDSIIAIHHEHTQLPELRINADKSEDVNTTHPPAEQGAVTQDILNQHSQILQCDSQITAIDPPIISVEAVPNPEADYIEMTKRFKQMQEDFNKKAIAEGATITNSGILMPKNADSVNIFGISYKDELIPLDASNLIQLKSGDYIKVTDKAQLPPVNPANEVKIYLVDTCDYLSLVPLKRVDVDTLQYLYGAIGEKCECRATSIKYDDYLVKYIIDKIIYVGYKFEKKQPQINMTELIAYLESISNTPPLPASIESFLAGRSDTDAKSSNIGFSDQYISNKYVTRSDYTSGYRKNGNKQLRTDPPIQKDTISPWANSTIERYPAAKIATIFDDSKLANFGPCDNGFLHSKLHFSELNGNNSTDDGLQYDTIHHFIDDKVVPDLHMVLYNTYSHHCLLISDKAKHDAIRNISGIFNEWSVVDMIDGSKYTNPTTILSLFGSLFNNKVFDDQDEFDKKMEGFKLLYMGESELSGFGKEQEVYKSLKNLIDLRNNYPDTSSAFSRSFKKEMYSMDKLYDYLFGYSEIGKFDKKMVYKWIHRYMVVNGAEIERRYDGYHYNISIKYENITNKINSSIYNYATDVLSSVIKSVRAPIQPSAANARVSTATFDHNDNVDDSDDGDDDEYSGDYTPSSLWGKSVGQSLLKPISNFLFPKSKKTTPL